MARSKSNTSFLIWFLLLAVWFFVDDAFATPEDDELTFVCKNLNIREAIPGDCSKVVDGQIVSDMYIAKLKSCALEASLGLYGKDKLVAWDWGRPRPEDPPTNSPTKKAKDNENDEKSEPILAGCPGQCAFCNLQRCQQCCLVYNCYYCSSSSPPSSCPSSCSYCDEDDEVCMANAIAETEPTDMEKAIGELCTTQLQELTDSLNLKDNNYCMGLGMDVSCIAMIYPKKKPASTEGGDEAVLVATVNE